MEPYEVSLSSDLENQLQTTVRELSLETVPLVSVWFRYSTIQHQACLFNAVMCLPFPTLLLDL